MDGYGQGAAIATLLHAMLLQTSTDAPGVLPGVLKKWEFQFKSYVFAQPKPGNWQFGHDFGQAAGNRGFAICVNNNRDWVPQVPLSVDLPENNRLTYVLEWCCPINLRLSDIFSSLIVLGGDVPNRKTFYNQTKVA
ncbi:MAG: lipase family protein [Acidobacteriaceae bacterium]